MELDGLIQLFAPVTPPMYLEKNLSLSVIISHFNFISRTQDWQTQLIAYEHRWMNGTDRPIAVSFWESSCSITWLSAIACSFLFSSSYFRNFLQDDHATAFVPSPSHFCQKVWSEFLRLRGDAISIQEYIYILLKALWPSSECSISYFFVAIAIIFNSYR